MILAQTSYLVLLLLFFLIIEKIDNDGTFKIEHTRQVYQV